MAHSDKADGAIAAARPTPPPPPPLQPQQSLASRLNDLLHRDYVTDCAFYLFWLGFWLLMPLPIFLGTLALALYDLATIKGYRQPCGPVLITGCDSDGGSGKALALRLAAQGWTVIATCSTEAGAASYNDKSGITAVKMDMVDEAEVKAVAAQLARAHPEGLYCLVNNNNNTAVGKDGLVEWMDIDDYKFQMEVNLYGFIRVTKAFLPLLKHHVRANPNKAQARIVTLNSNAGVVPGQPNASCYAAAKHACDGWLNSLRIEAKVFGIEAVQVNPCWHDIDIEYFEHDLFDRLPQEMQEEYGRDYYEKLTTACKAARAHISWRKDNITQALAHAVTAEKPRPYAVIGMDGRFVMAPLLMLPRRVYNAIIDYATPFGRRKPAALLADQEPSLQAILTRSVQ